MIKQMLTTDFAPSNARQHCRTVMIRSGGVPVALSVWHRHPEATTLLFYPGTMASPLMYTLLLEELWRQGLNVVGLHPLSHGLSPCVKKAFTFEDIVRNGRDAVRWIKEHFDGPVVVSGHSQGGILTLAHALHDATIDAAFPLCTLIPEMEGASTVTIFHHWEKHKQLLLGTLRFLAAACPRLPLPMTAYLSLAKALAAHRQVVAPRRYLRWSYPMSFVSSLFNLDLSDACSPGHIACPLILFTARNDALFSLPLMRDTLARIAAPFKKLEVIDGGGHMFAVSKIYVPQVAATVAAHCTGFGLPLRTGELPPIFERNTWNTRDCW